MKKLIIGTVAVIAIVLCSGFNKQILDFDYDFKTAYVKWPDGTMKVLKLKSWKDYDDGEQLQLKDTAGNVYLVSSINCVLTNN